jgi:tRNA nucleotidyltransferase (CCA-adding enzyme)
MHMPQQAGPDPILTGGQGVSAAALWQALAPQRWPLPPAQLPPGSALVGGAVRDALLGRLDSRPDLDLVVPVDAIPLTRELAARLGGSFVPLDPQRSIARLVLRGWTIDLARRAGADLAADLDRRDYTINAMALPLAGLRDGDAVAAGPGGELVDPHGGLADLAAGRMVAIREANLLDDPLRLLRGLRLAAELDFTVDPLTWSWIRRHRERLPAVAGERILAELERLAAAPAGSRLLAAAGEAGLLEPWADAELPHSGAGLAGLSPSGARQRGLDDGETAWALPLARLATVLSGEGLARLQASRRLQQRCRGLRRWRRRLAEQPPGGLGALAEAERLELQQALEHDLPALLLQLEPEQARAALGRWRDPADPLFHPRPPLDGRQLQEALDLKAGPELGRLLAALTRERAFGRLPAGDGRGRLTAAEQQAVLQEARRWLSRQGPAAPIDRRHD